MSEQTLPLAGLRVLVTRPAERAAGFCELLQQQGAVPLQLPVLAILPPTDPGARDASMQAWADYDLAVFISPTAVTEAMHWFQARDQDPVTASRTPAIAAVGNKTAQALTAAGLPPTVQPATRYDSEGLLALAALHHVQGQQVVLCKGEGGRELLEETLIARGARVTQANLYRRGMPHVDLDPWLQRSREGGLDLLTVTSVDALHNLIALWGEAGWPWLRRLPLLVGSERMAAAARHAGWQNTVAVAHDPSDEAMLAALLQWRQARCN